MMTAVALVNAASANLTVPGVSTFWANNAFGPASLKQGVVTLFFSAILLHKLEQTDAFLKLNLISCHDALLFLASSSLCSTYWLNS